MGKKRGRLPKTKAEKEAFSEKISQLTHEGYGTSQAQRVAIASSELAKGGLARLKKRTKKTKPNAN